MEVPDPSKHAADERGRFRPERLAIAVFHSTITVLCPIAMKWWCVPASQSYLPVIMSSHSPTSIEICAGAGGQALGLENAGFTHQAAFELDAFAVETLKANRPLWKAELADIRTRSVTSFRGVDLLAGGVPCPPFSIAGKQLGELDDRDLFPAALERIAEAEPRAVLLENVPGLAKARFAVYRQRIEAQLRKLGFSFVEGQILNASNFGLSQLRPRFVIVALRADTAGRFEWPRIRHSGVSVGELLGKLMAAHGWNPKTWIGRANGIAPTLVGGSRLHGGPDLGPTRSKAAWRELGVDGNGIANDPPEPDFPLDGDPKLTLAMTARLQGFPDDWRFVGGKTAAYRQIGNAFPPPVAEAVGRAIAIALGGQAANRPVPTRLRRIEVMPASRKHG